MISFIGNGALLNHAVKFSIDANYGVNFAVLPENSNSKKYLQSLSVTCIETSINSQSAMDLFGLFKPRICFSINNAFIIPNILLQNDTQFYNIHNGLVESYRGLSELCVTAAILNNEEYYGATLHKILPNQLVDRGAIQLQKSFAISRDITFYELMTNSLLNCKSLFECGLDDLLNDSLREFSANYLGSAYNYNNIQKAFIGINQSQLLRLKEMGPYKYVFPKLWRILSEI